MLVVIVHRNVAAGKPGRTLLTEKEKQPAL